MYSLLDIKLIECHWHSSRILLYLYIICVLVALIIIWLLPIDLLGSLLGTLILSCYSVWILLQQILLIMPNSFVAIRRSTTSWLIGNNQNEWYTIKLIHSSCIVLTWIVILRFHVEGTKRTFTICLPVDGISTDEHRRLRVFLRYLT